MIGTDMPTCFVMQPFDRAVFDQRFEDTFEPAIKAAGLEPYRVDRDPSVSIPIDDIQSGIRSAAICLAEITTDNPNVWFELGFAIASRKEVVLICSDERTSRFPFDVQHRNIIKYSTGSASDFKKLETKIIERIQAILKKQEILGQLASSSPIADVEGLSQHEMFTLIAIGQNIDHPTDDVTIYTIRQDSDTCRLDSDCINTCFEFSYR